MLIGYLGHFSKGSNIIESWAAIFLILGGGLNAKNKNSRSSLVS